MELKAFSLTPRSGERLAAADQLAQQANFIGLATGDGVVETSFGRNLGYRIALSNYHRYIRQEFGDASISSVPTAEYLQLTIPKGTMHLLGDSILLRGLNADGSQTFDLRSYPAGSYALVIESWVSVVGATTLGQANQPAMYVGVVDSDHKPDDTHVYLAGNLSGGKLPDGVLADTTIQTFKVFQRQYKISVLPDRDLIGWSGNCLPEDQQYAASNNANVVQCIVPQSLTAWDTATDRTFTACKLAALTISGGAVTIHSSDIRALAGYIHLGQEPVPVRLTREELESWLRDQVSSIQDSFVTLESRIRTLEAVRQSCQLASDQDQVVAPAGASGGVLPQRLRYTVENWDTEGWHDSISRPTQIWLPFDGVVQVSASATFLKNGAAGMRGLRLLQNGVPTAFAQTTVGDDNFDSSLVLSCELTVASGDYLEIEPWQGTGSNLTVIAGATFNVRRML